MNRIVEAVSAAIGAAAGAAVHGTTGMAVGAVIGFIVGIIGRRGQHGITMTSKDMSELESAMHLGLAASWGVHPLVIENGGSDAPRIADFIHQTLVKPFAEDVTGSEVLLEGHLATAMASGIAPYASMRHVKRRYAPRPLRKDTTVIDQLVMRVLQINGNYGNYDETRAWFVRWCAEIGVGTQAERLWSDFFAGQPELRMAEERVAHQELIDDLDDVRHDQAA